MNLIYKAICVCVCVHACVRVCVCVCERERERERETYKNFDAFHFANMLLKALCKSGIAILN